MTTRGKKVWFAEMTSPKIARPEKKATYKSLNNCLTHTEITHLFMLPLPLVLNTCSREEESFRSTLDTTHLDHEGPSQMT